jgi:small-conductance mechanosensitive channel
MSKIVNESGGPSENERIRITIGIEYGSNIEKVKNILIDIADSNQNVLDRPKARVRFRTFDESQITFQLLCWIEKPELRGKVIDELNTDIYNKFQDNNITIPFPQRTVHVINKN